MLSRVAIQAEINPIDIYSTRTKILASFIQLLLKTGGSHLTSKGGKNLQNIVLAFNIIMIGHENAIPSLIQYYYARKARELDILWDVFLKNIKPLLSLPQNKMELLKVIAMVAAHINRSCYIQAIQRIPQKKRRMDELVDWVSFSVIIIEFSADVTRLLLEYQDKGMTEKSIETLISFTSKFALLAYQIISEKHARIPESYLFYMMKDTLPFIVSLVYFLQRKNQKVNAMVSVEYFGALLYRYATDFYQRESAKGRLKNLNFSHKNDANSHTKIGRYGFYQPSNPKQTEDIDPVRCLEKTR